MKPGIVVLISGSGSNLQAIIDACSCDNIQAEISAVISNVPDAYGLERARSAGVKTHVLNHRQFNDRETYDTALSEKIDLYSPELIVLAGFMRILTPAFVQRYLGRLINIHPSLLPKYQGLHTHQRAIEAGDTKHGATVHYVTPELDSGPAILQGSLDIKPEDDANTLATRVLQEIEHQIYPIAVGWCVQKRVQFKHDRVLLDGELLPLSGFKYQS